MSKTSSIPRKLRVAQRTREVASVFLAHGLSDIVAHLELPAWMHGSETGGSDSGSTPANRTPLAKAHALSSPERLCRAFEELGPTFVKLGQFLSTRDDLLPSVWTLALARLQDSVQEVAWEDIEPQLVPKHGPPADPAISDSPFASIERTPLAAGSIAQVHRAKLKDARPVVLKILRPGVREIIEADLEVLRVLATFAARNSNLGFRPVEVLEQFAQDRLEEIDLLHEGRATDRLRRLFAKDADIVFPRVYWQATTPLVLVLEELDGQPFSRIDFSSLSSPKRRALVQRGARAVVRQCLEFGFFHADPHPGNLLLLEGERIGFVDCGIVGYLNSEQRRLLAQLVREVFAGRVARVQHLATRLADCPAGLEDEPTLQRRLHALLVDFDHATIESLDVTSLLRQLFDILRQHDATIPGDLLKLIKALATLESLAGKIDPEFSVLREVTRYTEAALLQSVSPTALRRRALDLAASYSALIEEFPQNARNLLDQLRHRKFELALSHEGLDRLTAALVFASRLLAAALLVASLLVAGSIVLLASRDLAWLQSLALAALAIAVVFGTVVVIKHFRYDQ